MKKFISLILVVAMLMSLAVMFSACTIADTEKKPANEPGNKSDSAQGEDARFADYTAVPYQADETIYDEYKALVEDKDVSEVKIGVILVGDEEEGYTLAHINGIKKMCEELGIDEETQVVYKKNIPEGDECLDAAKELVDDECNIIFANSFGHEGYMLQAAKKYKDVQFCHATGYQAASSGLKNMTNYFNNVYESRYISGIYAGYKLNELAEEKPEIVVDDKITIGYVGAFTYAEVISGYTSFYLGVKSACDYDVEMKVRYTGSWASQSLENDAANALIEEGCVLISQHADTTGAASACEAAGVYDVGYNVTMTEAAPNYAITSAALNWASYYTYAVANFIAGNDIAVDWSEGYATGAVQITEVNKAAFSKAETYNAAVEAANKAIEDIIAGKLHVFDTSTWTVKGKTITGTKKIDGYNGIQYIKKDGDVRYFAESTIASAPAFNFKIDGIVELNEQYGD